MIRTRIQKLLGCDIKKSGFTQISGLSWGHPREYGYPGVTMAEQLSIDILRAQMAQAKHMYASLDWTKIRHREFKAIMNELKALPKLPRNLRDKAVVSPEVSLPGDFPHGTYTVQYADDSYKVIRIALQPLDEDFMPGVALIGYQNGPNNKKDFRNFANVRPDGSISFWRRWTQPDLEKALVAVLGAEDGIYTTPEGDRVEVTKSDYCAKCGDVLTAPSTKNPYRDMGYGPECGKKVGLKK